MFGQARSGTFILRRSQMIDFIDSKPSERFDLISNILGFKNLDNIESALAHAANYYKEFLEEKKQFKTGILDRLSQELSIKIENLDTLLDIVNNKLTGFGFPILGSFDGIDTYISNILVNHGDIEYRRRINGLVNLLETWPNSILDQTLRDSIFQLNLEIKVGITKDVVGEISFGNLLNEGRRIIIDNNLSNCPLCENNIEISKTIEKIDENLHRLDIPVDKISKLKSGYSEIVGSLQKSKSTIDDLHNNLQHCEPDFTSEIASLKKISKDVDGLVTNILLSKDSHSPINDDICNSIDEALSEVIAQSYEKVKTIDSQGRSDKNQELIGVINLLKNITVSLEELNRIDTQIDLAKRRYDLSLKIKTIFQSTKKSIVQRIHDIIEEDIEIFYSVIHPNEDHSKIELMVDLSKNGSTSLRVGSYEKMMDPRAFESEGHLDSLGLCIFLAFIKHFNTECSLVILDDIVTTMDATHRSRFCKLLYEHFRDKQLIITTCDNIWYDQLITYQKTFGCQGKFENKMILGWNIDQGPVLSGYKPRLVKIREKLDSSDKAGAANEIRQYLEWLLKNICESIKAEVPFRSSGRYTVADLLIPSKKRVTKLCKNTEWESDILAKYGSLESAAPIANILSHDNLDAGSISKSEIEDLFDAVCNLHQAFLCKNCEEFLQYDQISSNLRCINNKCKTPTTYKTS